MSSKVTGTVHLDFFQVGDLCGIILDHRRETNVGNEVAFSDMATLPMVTFAQNKKWPSGTQSRLICPCVCNNINDHVS